ncbi:MULTISPECIES: hypothetical protein [Anaerotruncus]|jgi:hypothetical protein|uniref:Uncharacterized protein n=1 Tax=Anaerotruncus colihominis TaxID=169435 RepID=A0A845RHI5_9FIRM|nr:MULTISPECIES: hypothetical protein [Anaerotruncus]MCI8493331.1 hypothetical protein [Anaerotruncus sp.]MCR2026482.1 hypothetical protein [Anaerotruncus colihominis]NBI79063.1 hypothetical protein [Anaerotruncus colihominis]NDO40789.1 hypothetical protein [Anaerotruncus colihominis]
MNLIDHFDQQLLGYLRAHPDMLFRDAARALGVHTMIIDHRIQKLMSLGLLSMEPQGAFRLTDRALTICTSFPTPGDEDPIFSEFSWTDLYIPLNLTLE